MCFCRVLGNSLSILDQLPNRGLFLSRENTFGLGRLCRIRPALIAWNTRNTRRGLGLVITVSPRPDGKPGRVQPGWQAALSNSQTGAMRGGSSDPPLSVRLRAAEGRAYRPLT